MNTEVRQLFDTIAEKKELLCVFSHKITLLEEEINEMKKMLYISCEHECERDWEDRDERSRWICKHCKLSRNPYHN